MQPDFCWEDARVSPTSWLWSSPQLVEKDQTASNHPKDLALLPLALLRKSTNLLTKRIGLDK